MKDTSTPMKLDELLKATRSSAVEYTTMTCAELAAGNFKNEYLVDQVMVKGQPIILGGGKKNLKTCLLVDLGLSLATATPFLGRFSVPRKHRTLLMSGESGTATLQETSARICAAKGLDLASVEGLLWSEQLPTFGDQHHLLAIERLVQGEGIEVLMIDPAYLAMPSSDPGNLFEMGRLLRGMNDICRTHGVSLLLCHHTKKGGKNQFQPAELEELSWSGFQEWCRQWVLLSRREAFVPGSGVHRLWMTVGGSAGHSGLWGLNVDEGTEKPRRWEVDVLHVDEIRREDHANSLVDLETKLLEALHKLPEGASQTTLAEAVGVSGGRAKEALNSLVKQGKVKCVDSPHRKNTKAFILGDE